MIKKPSLVLKDTVSIISKNSNRNINLSPNPTPKKVSIKQVSEKIFQCNEKFIRESRKKQSMRYLERNCFKIKPKNLFSLNVSTTQKGIKKKVELCEKSNAVRREIEAKVPEFDLIKYMSLFSYKLINYETELKSEEKIRDFDEKINPKREESFWFTIYKSLGMKTNEGIPYLIERVISSLAAQSLRALQLVRQKYFYYSLSDLILYYLAINKIKLPEYQNENSELELSEAEERAVEMFEANEIRSQEENKKKFKEMLGLKKLSLIIGIGNKPVEKKINKMNLKKRYLEGVSGPEPSEKMEKISIDYQPINKGKIRRLYLKTKNEGEKQSYENNHSLTLPAISNNKRKPTKLKISLTKNNLDNYNSKENSKYNTRKNYLENSKNIISLNNTQENKTKTLKNFLSKNDFYY
ncbi:MAG: hypothetical protein MJ252_03990 [archaeon]|nr:hypothetical protein [archaeon]